MNLSGNKSIIEEANRGDERSKTSKQRFDGIIFVAGQSDFNEVNHKVNRHNLTEDKKIEYITDFTVQNQNQANNSGSNEDLIPIVVFRFYFFF